MNYRETERENDSQEQEATLMVIFYDMFTDVLLLYSEINLINQAEKCKNFPFLCPCAQNIRLLPWKNNEKYLSLKQFS